MACGGIGAQAASPAEDIAARAFVAWNNGFNSADVKALASLYAPDAIVLPATHAIVEGVGEIESFFAGLFAKHVTDSTIEPIRVMEAGDSLIVASKWQAHGRDDSGALTTIGGSATHVFKRQPDGSYKLVLQTFN
jgi:uncharacterized protein (TIGR02246 family)